MKRSVERMGVRYSPVVLFQSCTGLQENLRNNRYNTCQSLQWVCVLGFRSPHHQDSNIHPSSCAGSLEASEWSAIDERTDNIPVLITRTVFYPPEFVLRRYLNNFSILVRRPTATNICLESHVLDTVSTVSVVCDLPLHHEIESAIRSRAIRRDVPSRRPSQLLRQGQVGYHARLRWHCR